MRVLPCGRAGQRARRAQLQVAVAGADVRGALEAVRALRVTPVVHHGGLERAALLLGRLLGTLLPGRERRDSRGLRLLVVLLAQPREEVLGRAALVRV